MDHFPRRNHIPLSEPEIPPHFAARSAGNSAPNHNSPSHRSFPEETTLGKDNNGQDHSRQLDGTNPAPQITYPTLPPSPPALPASKPTYPLPHHSESSMCPTRDCGWRTAYLTLRRMVKKMMDEKEENVREFRWAIDDMEGKMYLNANFLDERDGKWQDCGGTPDAEGDADGWMGGADVKVAWGDESSAEAPPSSRHNGVVAYPDLSSGLARLEREEERLGMLQGMGGEVSPRSKSSPGVPPQYKGDGLLDGDLYPELRRTVSRV